MSRTPTKKYHKQTKAPPTSAQIRVDKTLRAATGEKPTEEQIQGILEQLMAYTKALPLEKEPGTLISEILSSNSKAAVVKSLEVIAATEPEGAVELLRHLSHHNDNDIALAAIRGLGKTKSEVAAAALVPFLHSRTPRTLRDAARRSLYVLRTSGVDTMAIMRAKTAPAEGRRLGEKPPIYRGKPFKALVSHIDGMGNRLLFLGVERPLGIISALTVLLNDHEGILNYDSHDMNGRKFDRLVDEYLKGQKDKGITWAEIPSEYALYLGKEASDRPGATAQTLPGFAPWRDMFLRQAPQYERPLVYDELNPSQVKWDPSFLEKSAELIELPEFSSWYHTQQDTSKEALKEYQESIKSPLALPEGYRETKESKALEAALTKIYGDDYLRILKRRLEEMALVLLRTRRPALARQALAAALTLEQEASVLLAKHPFIKALVDKSLQHLEEGGQGPKPTLWLPEQRAFDQLPPALK